MREEESEHEVLLRVVAAPQAPPPPRQPPGGAPEIITAQRILACACRLGEGIVYDGRTSSVLWTDIYGRRLHRLRLVQEEDQEGSPPPPPPPSDKDRDVAAATGTDEARGDKGAAGSVGATTHLKTFHSAYELPKQLCSFGLLDSPPPTRGGGDSQSSSPPPPPPPLRLPLLCAWEDGFSLFDVAMGEELSSPSVGPPVNPNGGATRLNDGRVDPSGARYVCGGFYGDAPGFYEKVFAVGWDGEQKAKAPQLAHHAIVDRIQTTNSIAWTLDGRRMYLADSAAKTIWTHSYDPQAPRLLSDRQVLCKYPPDQDFVPDGSCVDSDGFLWNAVWCHGDEPGKVHRIDPATGDVVLTVRMPDLVSQVSCCCFGGQDLDVLFITTAREGRDRAAQPRAGDLYAVKLAGVRGRPESRFQVPPSVWREAA